MGKPTVPQPGLGAVLIPDDRDKNYPLGVYISRPRGASRPEHIRHPTFFPPLDQGSTSQCVDYVMAEMEMHWSGLWVPPWVLGEGYHWMQQHDEFPGTEANGVFGTSTRTGMEWLRLRGTISEYRHAQNIDEIVDFVCFDDPIAVGTPWLTSMDEPFGKTGVVKVTRSSPHRGGHCYLVKGYHDSEGLVECQQTWGLPFGNNGTFLIQVEDLDWLVFQNYGDAIAGIEVSS